MVQVSCRACPMPCLLQAVGSLAHKAPRVSRGLQALRVNPGCKVNPAPRVSKARQALKVNPAHKAQWALKGRRGIPAQG